MKTKKVLRHYCDFCGKGMFKKPAMEEHEALCTMNPKRKCWLCEGVNLEPIVAEIKRRENSVEVEQYELIKISSENLKWLREQVKNCPACILAALRQSNCHAFQNDSRIPYDGNIYFNYRAELDDWRKEEGLRFGFDF